MMTLFEKIQSLLRVFPGTRDSDYLLYYWVLKDHGFDPDNSVVTTLLKKSDKAEVPTLESVSRLRRRAQEEDEKLRGEKYLARKRAEELRRKEIHALS